MRPGSSATSIAVIASAFAVWSMPACGVRDRGGGELRRVCERHRADAEIRVDRRHDLADVAHVAAARREPLRIDERLAERLAVAAVGVAHRPVVEHWCVLGRFVPVHGQLAAGRQCARLETVPHALLELHQVARLERAHVERSSGDAGNDVRRLATARDDAVDARVRADVVAKLRDRLVRRDERVERVHSLLREHRRVHGLTPVFHVDMGDAEHRHVHDVGRRRVRHHRHVDIVEAAGSRHDDLAAVELLRRRAEDDDARVGRIQRPDQRRRGADSDGRDEVVAAGVANLRQRVVLGADGNRHGPAPPLAAERRVDAIRVLLHGEALRFEEWHELRVRVVLLERQLRVCVNLARDADEVAGDGIDRRLRALLGPVDSVADAGHRNLLFVEVRLYRRYAWWELAPGTKNGPARAGPFDAQDETVNLCRTPRGRSGTSSCP